MQKKTLIVVNLAGALLKPIDEVISIWCQIIRGVGLLPDYKLIYDNFGEDFETCLIPKMAEEYGWSNLQIETIISRAKKVFKDINTSTNAALADKLRSLKDIGYALAVVSNKTREKLFDGLLKIGCPHDVFDYIKTGEDGIKKPDIRVFEKFLLDFDQREITLVGDSFHFDYRMAKEAGVNFIAIATKCHPKAAWMPYVPEENIFESLPQYIDSLLSVA